MARYNGPKTKICRKFGEPGVAGVALRPAELHFDEFVVLKGTLCFRDDGGSDPCIANEQHRIQCVPQSPKVLALTF